jgi:hypothetical protein
MDKRDQAKAASMRANKVNMATKRAAAKNRAGAQDEGMDSKMLEKSGKAYDKFAKGGKVKSRGYGCAIKG